MRTSGTSGSRRVFADQLLKLNVEENTKKSRNLDFAAFSVKTVRSVYLVVHECGRKYQKIAKSKIFLSRGR